MSNSGETTLERLYWLVAVAAIAVLAVTQYSSMVGETATWDEPVHLAAGYSYWTLGDFEMNPEHPPLAKLLFALPAYLYWKPQNGIAADWDRGQVVSTANMFLYRNSLPAEALLFSGRCVNISLTLLFALYLAWWAKRRFGPQAAMIALSFFVLDPNITAHGRYITMDLAAAFLIFTTSTLWIEYLIMRKSQWLILTGISVGAACSAKYSTLYLVPLLAIAFWLRPQPWRGRVREFFRCAAIAGAMAFAVVVLVYWPEVRRSGELPELGPRITRLGPAGPAVSFLADRLHAKAYTFLIGLDRLSEHHAVGHPGYLLGQIREYGWWYYFPVTFLVKTPLALLAGLALGAATAFRLRPVLCTKWLPAAILAATSGFYFLIASQSNIQIGVRHLLPVYAPLFVLTGWVLSAVSHGRPISWILMVLLAVESASIYPNHLTFFNAAVGGPNSGPKYLLDSNLDWGQAARQLGNYMKQRNIVEVCLSFFGNVDLPGVGVRHIPLPAGIDPASLDCVAAISATPLYGLYTGREAYAAFRLRKPDAIIGNSIYVYDLRNTHQ